jgi:hypothetical protein
MKVHVVTKKVTEWFGRLEHWFYSDGNIWEYIVLCIACISFAIYLHYNAM